MFQISDTNVHYYLFFLKKMGKNFKKKQKRHPNTN